MDINKTNMNTFFTTLRVKSLRKRISSPGYHLYRLNEMNSKIQYWLLSLRETNTVAGRNYCNMMVNMYLKRYQFYINK